LADGIHKQFTNSPVSDKLLIKDLCYRGVGFLGQHGKETKTSWDTLSYTLLQSHNVFTHINAVQEANRRYEQGIHPAMVRNKNTGLTFGQLIDKIFACKTKQESLTIIDEYELFWTQMQSGSQGFSGKKTINSRTKYNELFDEENDIFGLLLNIHELLFFPKLKKNTKYKTITTANIQINIGFVKPNRYDNYIYYASVYYASVYYMVVYYVFVLFHL
jgi:hypothetical protein